MDSIINFITPEYLKNHTPAGLNLNEDDLPIFIDEAEEIYIRDILGDKLYNKLKNDLVNDTLTGIYKTLVDENVCKATAYWSLYNALPFIKIQITNKGIVEKHSDYSESTDLKGLNLLMTEIRNKAEFYSQRITIFLEKNFNDIPELTQTDYLDEAPRNSNYFGGIYLPDNTAAYDRIEAIKNIRYL